jgi:hypothetical protein
MQLRLVILFSVLLAGGPVVADSASIVADAAAKSAGTPDFCQTDKEGQFDNGGRKFCGPVAMSNALIWFAENGYPQLLSGKNADKTAQIELIHVLGSPAYMRTEGADGTNVRRLMEGAEKYVAERGQRFAKLEYRGRSVVPKKQKPTDARPTLKWVAEAVASPRGGACVNIGWYTHDAATDTYTRRGGHWMTATAAGADGDRPTIDLHDPASRSGKGKVTHHARLQRLTSGTLTGKARGLPTEAAGLFTIRDGIVPKQVLKGETTWPIIDGIVVMVMERR